MKFDELLESHKIYGTSESDIVKRRGYQNILKQVVVCSLAPFLVNYYC